MPAKKKRRAARTRKAARRPKKRRVNVRRARAVARRVKRRRKVKVKVTYHKKPKVTMYRPDNHVQTKRALAYIIFAVALAIGVTAFYDLTYYTAYIVQPAGADFVLTLADGSGGTASGDGMSLALSMGEAIVGEASSNDFTLTLGAMGFLAGDISAPVCTIEQSTGTPNVGEEVELTVECTDDTGLETITLHTDESGTMEEITDYGSPADVSGTEATTVFLWSNPDIGTDTTVTWKVVASDIEGNEGESTTLAFTIGAAPDLAEPTVSRPVASPGIPAEGASVIITADLSDNVGLASADLIVNGEIEDTVSVSGTSDTAEFTWTAGPEGTYTIKVSAADAAGNTDESTSLVLSIVSAECDADLKPEDVLGECVDGLQTKTAYTCDATTGTWKETETFQECAPAPPVAFIAIGVAGLAIALAAALYILRRPKGPKTPKKKRPSPPATFG